MAPDPAEPREPGRPLRIAFHSQGCKLNLYESAGLSQAAARRRHVVVPMGEAADVVVLNTCSVTGRADQEARQLLRRLHRRRPEARLVVTGCYAQRAPAELAALPGVALVAGHAEKDDLADWLDALPAAGAGEIRVGPLRGKTTTALRALGAEGRTRAYLRVQDGCDAACSYCVIPSTRGSSRSLSLREIEAEARSLLDAGFREIVLTGVHLGRWGCDLRPVRRFSELVELLVRLPSPHAFRLRLSSLEPREVDERLVDILAGSGVLAPHLHLPLQSGSDPVLRAMRRSYRTREYRERVLAVAARVSPLALGADLLVGFPGETEADFRRTAAFLAEIPFTHLHAFSFSPRPGTEAAGFPGRPPGNVTARRREHAAALVAEKGRRFRESFLGRVVRVLVEAPTRPGRIRGWSDHYLRVTVAGEGGSPGRFALVKVNGFDKDGLRGELVATLP